MAKILLRNKAIELRKSGHSYSEIKEKLKVEKGTLSYWLKNYPLSDNQLIRIRSKKFAQIEKFRKTMQLRKDLRLKNAYNEIKSQIGVLSERDFFISGLFLYWGEGSKTSENMISITNTDPSLLYFFLRWCTKSFKVEITSIWAQLHLYSDMNPDLEHEFWSKALSIPRNQFWLPYIKNSESSRINHKGGFGHGSCRLAICDASLSRKVHMGIKVISEN